MAKKEKKTLIVFLGLIAALWSTYGIIQDMSNEFQIPVPILASFIVIIYLLWKDN